MAARGDGLFGVAGDLRREPFSAAALRALHESVRHARSTHWESVRTPHLFMGLLSSADSAVLEWCGRLPVDPGDLLYQFEESFHSGRTEPPAPLRLNREFLSDNALAILRDARRRSLAADHDQVAPTDLLVTILATPRGIVAECIRRIGFAPERLLELAVLGNARRNRR